MLNAVQRLDAARETNCTPEMYEQLYRRSVEDPDGFWLEQAKRLDWVTPLVGGVTQSRRLACSSQKPSGSSTERR